MKKLVSASLLTLGLSMSVFAVQSAPISTKGSPLDPKYAGTSTCEITSSTGTNAVLCASGAGIIIEIYASSMAVTDALVIRDSATANTTSTVLLALDKTTVDARGRFYPRFKNGLSVNALTAPTAPGSASRPNWTILYTKDIN